MNDNQKYQLTEVADSKAWRSFLKLPWKIYEHDAAWVAPLLYEQKKLIDKNKNPFFKHAETKAWIVCKGSQAVGRILAYVDHRYNEHYREKTGFFGFFECVNRQQVADILLEKAAAWLKQMGMERIRGPINFDIANECGVLLSGFEYSPTLQMGHSLPYYHVLFEASRFSKAHDLLAYRLRKDVLADTQFVDRLKNASNRVLENNQISFRKLRMNDYKEEMVHINNLYNEFMDQNWGFVPTTTEDMMYTADSLKQIVDPKMVFFAEKKAKIAGCSISLPDINQVLRHMNGKLFPFGFLKFLYFRKKITRIRLILLGIQKEYRNRGLDVFFYYHTMKKVFESGYDEAELSWISESNTCLISIVHKFGAELYKRYRVFEKAL
jgi:hypothetical protein